MAAEVRLPKGMRGLRLFSFVTYMRRRQSESSNRRHYSCLPFRLSTPQLGVLSSGVIRNGENLHSEQANVILMQNRCFLGEKTRPKEHFKKSYFHVLFQPACQKVYQMNSNANVWLSQSIIHLFGLKKEKKTQL